MSESTKKPEQAEENTTPETAPAEDTKKAEKKASKSSKKDRIAELEKELEKAQQSLKESADNFLRLAAEYDNFRKRSLREKDDIKIRSKTDVVEKLLPVIDNFERAAMNAEADADSYRKGVEQIYRQFGDILPSPGIVAFGPMQPGRECTEHQQDEYILLEDLFQAGEIYRLTIEKLANLEV